MTTAKFFTYQEPIRALLEATLLNAVVKTSVTVEEASKQRGSVPTVHIVFLSDESIDGNDSVVLLERNIVVMAYVPGATSDRTDLDDDLCHGIFLALHGEMLPGYSTPLELQSIECDYEGSARRYYFVFSARTKLAKRIR